jgi:Ser/Thr protein kinase RdoA (MazF antagonist)
MLRGWLLMPFHLDFVLRFAAVKDSLSHSFVNLTRFNICDLIQHQIIHADLAHYNLVASGVKSSFDGTSSDSFLHPSLNGIIDFGDVVRSWVVADLATAIASLLVFSVWKIYRALND